MQSNLNSLQTTISDLKEIVARNQGANHESALLVKQMEQLVQEMEKKAKKRPLADIPAPPLQSVPAL